MKCSDCNNAYVDQTGMNTTDHLDNMPSLNELEILHIIYKGHQLNNLEALEIYKHNSDSKMHLLYNQLDVSYLSLFTTVIPTHK